MEPHSRQQQQQDAAEREHAKNMRFLEDNFTEFEEKSTPSSPCPPPRFPLSSTSAAASQGYMEHPGNDPVYRGSDHSTSDHIMAPPERVPSAPVWPQSDERAPLHLNRANTVMNTSTAASTPSSVSTIDDSTGDSISSQPSFSVPDASRKRRRESLSSSNEPTAKSFRETQSPAVTGTTTPSSFDSIDIPEDSDLFRLLGDTRKDIREMREDQRAQEAALRARKEQEERDAAFARELAEQMEHVASSDPPSSQAGPSTLHSRSAQSYFAPNGKIQLPFPSVQTSPSIKRSPPSLYKQEYGRSAFASPNRVNSERLFGPPARLPENADFIDLDDGDNDFVDLTGLPSSDVVELGPSDNQGNSSASVGRQLPWLKSEPQIATINGVDGLSGRYPSHSSPGPLGWGKLAGNAMQVGMNAVQNVYNAGRQILDPPMSGFGPGPPYGQPGYGVAGSSYNPITFSSDDDPTDFYDPYSAFNALSDRINVTDPRHQDLVRQYRDRVEHLTHDPTRTTEELKSLLENIRPDEELDPKSREGTPDAMVNPLYEHQKLGLAWMKKMEEGSNKGGILADDMGLGKTIQALALMVSRRSENPSRKTTLIVAPVALMRQWEKEIRTRLKTAREHRLSSFILHGANRGTTWEHLKTYDVVLTTFGTLATELKRKDAIDMAKRANPNWRPTSKADQLPLLGDNCKWYRVIIDEAQCIKNKSTNAAVAASHLQALTRFCMTGTPMMNNVGELYSLIRFLRIKPYNVSERFNRDFTKPLRNGDAKNAMQKLQALLKAILLRRTKKSTIDGKPILNLPERTTQAQRAEFSDEERDFYRGVEGQMQLQFNKYLKAGTVGRNYTNILVLLLRLRQACCHPHLLKDFGQPAGTTELTMEEMVNVAKELAPDVIARLQEQSGTQDLSGLECPICMDTSENSLIIIPCGHSTCSECFARITDPSQAIANGDTDGTRNDIKCPNCRGKIDLKKVISHEAFKRAHMPGFDLGIAGTVDDDETDDGSESESEEEDDDSDETNSLDGFVVDDDVVDEDETTDGSQDEAEGYRKGKTPFEKSAKPTKKKKKPKKGKGKAKATEEKPKKSLADLKKEGQRNQKAHKRYLNRLRKEYIPSTKIEKAVELLRAAQEGKAGEKTIVFSQFTSLLDLLEVPIDAEGWRYKRYDGSMSAKARDQAVTEFTEKENCKIMLVSLKAGNAGLNLVAASQVIIFDPFWNPYIEEQAIDRAHRIGQLRPVQVHRILVPDTVEDRILALQERKRQLIESALDEKASQNISRLGTRELAFLFGVSH